MGNYMTIRVHKGTKKKTFINSMQCSRPEDTAELWGSCFIINGLLVLMALSSFYHSDDNSSISTLELWGEICWPSLKLPHAQPPISQCCHSLHTYNAFVGTGAHGGQCAKTGTLWKQGRFPTHLSVRQEEKLINYNSGNAISFWHCGARLRVKCALAF